MPFPFMPFEGQPVLFDGGLAIVAQLRGGLIVLHDGRVVRPSQIRAHFED